MKKEIRNSILCGVLATFLYELIKIIIKYLQYGGTTIMHFLSDYRYYLASYIDDTALIHFLLSICLGIIVGSIVFFILFSLFRKAGISFSHRKWPKKGIKLFMVIYSSFCIALLIIQFYFITFALTLKHSYQIAMIEIKPYISTEKYDRLNSDWVQMGNQKDYQKIQNTVMEVVVANHLKFAPLKP